MDQSRRDAMRIASALALAFGAGLLRPSDVFADEDDAGITRSAENIPWGSDWNGAVYSAKSLEAFVIAMNGDTTTPNTPRTVVERGKVPGLFVAKPGDLLIDAPELAENGTNVPVTIRSNMPDTDFIALIADHNPMPVCVGFNVLPENDAEFSVRIKVAETSTLVAAARAGGKWYFTLRDITVMIGGCLG